MQYIPVVVVVLCVGAGRCCLLPHPKQSAPFLPPPTQQKQHDESNQQLQTAPNFK